MVSLKIFVTFCAFVADWLLFIFPLLQGKMELMDSNSVFKKYQSSHHQGFSLKGLFKNIIWVIPPLRIYYLKKYAGKELFDLSLNKEDFAKFYGFYNKSIAWYYVSYAGFLDALYTTYEMTEYLPIGEWSLIIFIVIVVILTYGGISYTNYMVSSNRKINLVKKIAKNHKNKIHQEQTYEKK
ncbi:hypothetical protein IV52_GL000530 [Fructilactobacillus lindneri DSM 20690 = JCM 11027]|uniref:Integral membrane protein n=1 Tax=Fructilactobacillus lindneri DSM 20690 = JCM 11027 TaxID=1122148 RepID=A0A0R2JUT6_9LACO|nr:hypothetical protein IV52_GL000530 [Fructilactobacillus lindneri DSM 20690 = JCM 11027]